MLPVEIQRCIRSFLIPQRCDGRYYECLVGIKLAYEENRECPIELPSTAHFIFLAEWHAKLHNAFFGYKYHPSVPMLVLASRAICKVNL